MVLVYYWKVEGDDHIQGQTVTLAGTFILLINKETANQAKLMHLYFAGETNSLKETLAMNKTIKYQKRHIS
jgi:hypothetical protein